MHETYNKPVALEKKEYVMWGNGDPSWSDPRHVCTRQFSKHIIWLCHKKPMSASEIADRLNVPTVYVEEELEILTSGEYGKYGLLKELGNGRSTINFILLDQSTIEKAHAVYFKQLPDICNIVYDFIMEHKDEYLSFPYLNKKIDMIIGKFFHLYTDFPYIQTASNTFRMSLYKTRLTLPNTSVLSLQPLVNPRATIRFYEKQKLIHPKRGENAYRDYSIEDIAVLKKIIIFRKLGLPVSEIEDLLDGVVDLPESIDKNIKELQKQIKELNGALEICRQIQKRKEEMSTFDENFYWEELHKEENAGNRFLDITGDLLRYEKDDVIETLSATDSEGNPRHTKGMSIFKTILLILACCHWNVYLYH